MGKIRFVGTGETRGYPYLVCKKKEILSDVFFVRMKTALLQIALRNSELLQNKT